jgi:MerR family transcriptional regulator, redox-sensitive transcriptional activator SoxR
MLTIGQVASRAGLQASAIRYYEAQGLVPRVGREGGKRVYEASILERLAVIRLAKMAGFDLEEIRRAISEVGSGQPAPIWRTLVDAKRADLDEQISKLVAMKSVLERVGRCTCPTLDECGRAFNKARSQQPPDPAA